MTVVLDSSAVIAYLLREPGHDTVAGYLDDAVLSAVNAAETINILLRRGYSLADARASLGDLAIPIEPLTVDVALHAGEFANRFSAIGLSLGDCCCLALAFKNGAEVLTADRQWAKIDLRVRITLIR